MQEIVSLKSAGQITPLQPVVRAQWHTGTLLQATVVDTSAEGRVQLQIGRQTIDARTSLPLRTGETINLKVGHTGELTVLTKTADANASVRATGPELRAASVSDALRGALPKQQSMTTLLANVQAIATANEASGIAPRVVAMAREFLAQLPGHKQLSGFGGLNDLLALSGVAHEALTAAGRESSASDLKSALLRLAAQLTSQSDTAGTKATPARPPVVARETLPPLREGAVQAQPRAAPTIDLNAQSVAHLLRDVDASLARIQLSQLASLPVDDSDRQVWMFELALRDSEEGTDLVQFRIEKEPSRGSSDEEEEGARWTVNVALDLEELGAIEARIGLQGKSVSAFFRTARTDTGALIEDRLDALRESLGDNGLELATVTCGPSNTNKPQHPQARLIEERA